MCVTQRHIYSSSAFTLKDNSCLVLYPAAYACAPWRSSLLLLGMSARCSAVSAASARCSPRCRGSSGVGCNEAVWWRVAPDGPPDAPRSLFFVPAGDGGWRLVPTSDSAVFVPRRSALTSAGECPSLRTFTTVTCSAPQVGHPTGVGCRAPTYPYTYNNKRLMEQKAAFFCAVQIWIRLETLNTLKLTKQSKNNASWNDNILVWEIYYSHVLILTQLWQCNSTLEQMLKDNIGSSHQQLVTCHLHVDFHVGISCLNEKGSKQRAGWQLDYVRKPWPSDGDPDICEPCGGNMGIIHQSKNNIF